MTVFTDVMDLGIELVEKCGYLVPNYLSISCVQEITLSDYLDPTQLSPDTLYVYDSNLYLTDNAGNIAFIDCCLTHVSPTAPIRSSHPEYKRAGGEGRDAGHLGLSLGQHPSIAMEQDAHMNRWGVWRVFERYWTKLMSDGYRVRIIGVFVEGEDTYSPFWCIHEAVDGEINEYIFTNDDEQN